MRCPPMCGRGASRRADSLAHSACPCSPVCDSHARAACPASAQIGSTLRKECAKIKHPGVPAMLLVAAPPPLPAPCPPPAGRGSCDHAAGAPDRAEPTQALQECTRSMKQLTQEDVDSRKELHEGLTDSWRQHGAKSLHKELKKVVAEVLAAHACCIFPQRRVCCASAAPKALRRDATCTRQAHTLEKQKQKSIDAAAKKKAEARS